MRRLLAFAVVPMLALSALPGSAHDEGDTSPPDPRNRLNAWIAKEPGTRETIKLQYGPYAVHPGSDLSRVDFELSALDGFVIAARPSARYADGKEAPDDLIHIHHAHWVVVDPNAPGGNRWFFGTGEEKTRGGGQKWVLPDPRHETDGLAYGVQLNRGDKLGLISMLHNKSAQTQVVWLEGEFEFVHGTRQQLAERGWDMRPLTPVLHGATYQVPRGDADHTWPLELDATGVDQTKTGIVPGVGHVWESPFDGMIVIGAGHLHPGGRSVMVSNLGRKDDPCGESYLADPDGDGLPGELLVDISAYYREGVFPSEDFQMGVTQYGWRARVRKGDRIAINGIYDASRYAYPDAMSFFGFYSDATASEGRAPGASCAPLWLGDGGSAPPIPGDYGVRESMPNRAWSGETRFCGDSCVDPLRAPLEKGQWSNQVHIGGFVYLPGDQGVPAAGAPWVRRGEQLRFVNEDWGAGLVRHSVTSCEAPCNGPYKADNPFHDGVFDSGPLGATPVDTSYTTQQEPHWELDTSTLDPGYYTYYCRLHPWMRGAFYVDAAA